MAKRNKKSRQLESNRNARIGSRKNTANTVVTKTEQRDEGSLIAEARSKSDGQGASRLFIRDADGRYVTLNGYEARTVYRTLRRHFLETGRVFWR